MSTAAVPVLALAVDRLVGEPPRAIHPVVGIGHLLDAAARRRRDGHPPHRQVLGGAVGLALTCGVAVTAARALRAVAGRLPRTAATVVEAVALSTLLSERMLVDEVRATDDALARGDLSGGRRHVAGLVSRDVTGLDATAVREAAVESAAENLSDSVVAPLWWYALGGLPAAALYRTVNTADAMWGYRTAPWRWWGAAAARIDDVLNWVPARLTAVALAPRAGLRRVAVQAGATASPNAGWPMAAVALRHDLRLSKPGAYVLHPAGRVVRSADVTAATADVRRVAVGAAAVATVLAAVSTGSWRRP